MTNEFIPPAADETESQAEASTESHGSGVSALVGQAGEVLVVERPAPGQTVEIQAAAAQTYVLNVAPGEAQVEVQGDNLILGFDDDGDGTPDSWIVFLGLVSAVDAGQAPVFQVAGVEIAGEVLLAQALALAGEEDNSLDTALGEGPTSGGVSQYSDDFGDSVGLLDAEDVIPPTELQFGLVGPEDENTLPDAEDAPPLADPVLTPAAQGEVPEALQDALAIFGGDGGEGENLPEIVLFKQLDVDGEIGDDDGGNDPEVGADFGGADAETALGDLVFTLLSLPTFGDLILVASDGTTSFLAVGDTFASDDTVWWVATADQVDDFLSSNELQLLPDVEFDYSVTDESGNVATAPAVITIDSEVLPPEVVLSLPDEVDCIKEDSGTGDAANEVTLNVSAQGDDEITEIVITGFQANWAYDLSGLETDGASLTDSDPSDGSITLSVPNLANYSGSFSVQPPAESDEDHPTITATATVVDALEPGLSESGDGSFDIPVDAVVDGSEVDQTAAAEGDENTEIPLNLEIDLGGDSTTGPGESQGGTDKDGSESVTQLVVFLPLGTLGWVLPASIAEPNDAQDNIWAFDTSGADLADVQALVSSLSVTPPADFFGDIDVKVVTTTAEAATAGENNGTSGEECDDGDNIDVDTYEFTVTVNSTAVPVLIVGENVDDVDGEDTPHRLHEPTSGQDLGEILGGDAGDVLIGDVGGSELVNKAMNLVLVLDTSNSMEEPIEFDGENARRIEALDQAVEQLLDNIVDTEGATVRLHMVSFADDVKEVGTFDIITNGEVGAAELQAAKDFILAAGDNSLDVAQGDTNYEAGFRAAHDWLSDDANTLDNPDFNTTIFISDGAPNRAYRGESTTEVTDRIQNQPALDHVLGQFAHSSPAVDDEVSEFDLLHGPFKGVAGTVDAVGINTDADATDLLSQVDDGEADSIDDSEELADVLGDLAQVTSLAAVGGDVIVGSGGGDLIFGDTLFTDLLAEDESIALPPGAGWAVMEQLIATGEFDTDPSKTQAEEITDFLRDPANQAAYDFGRESVTDSGVGREGGADDIDGGEGNDTIFGQEGGDTIDGGGGNDTIVGGTGNDSMTGGDGDDVFVWTDQFFAGESDTVAGFESGAGGGDVLDVTALLDGVTAGAGGSELDDYLQVTFGGGNTTIGVDADGDGSGFTDVTIVVTGVDLTGGGPAQADIIDDLIASGDLAAS